MTPSRQPVYRAAGAALALPFRSAPMAATATLALTVFAGVAPASAAWLTMLLVEELTAGSASTGRAVLFAVAAAIAGGLAIALLYLAGHLAEIVQQRVTLTVESRLFRRTSTLPGLGHIEDPAFHDRLRLAEQAAQEAPGAISMFVQELIRSTVLLTSFTAALLAVWPPMAPLLLGSMVTAVVARLATSRREVATEEAWVATDRRQASHVSAEPAVVITRAPNALASWIAVVPMPDEPPWMSRAPAPRSCTCARKPPTPTAWSSSRCRSESTRCWSSIRARARPAA